MEERIQDALAACRPYLQKDGGDVRFVRFVPESGVVELVLQGTCSICPLSKLTLRAGIERAIMRDVPEVRRVEAVPG